MSEKLRQLKEKRAALYANILQMRDAANGRQMTAEERANWDKAMADHDAIEKEIATEQRFLDIQARQAKENTPQTTTEEIRKIESRAFAKYVMGVQLTEEEARALISPESRDALTPGATGAALVPSSISAVIEKALGNGTQFLSAIDMFTTTSGGDLTIPTINDTEARAKIVAAYEKSQRGQKPFGSLTFKSYTYRTPLIPISYEMIQDAAFNIEQEVTKLLSENFTRGLNYDFTRGSEGGEIKGIVAEATAVKAAGAEITFDDLMDLESALKAGYLPNAKWMFNRKTKAALMKLKDNNEQYIWQPGVTNATAPTILGYEYVINDDMTDIEASSTPIIFGDLKKFRFRNVRNYTAVRFSELLGEYLAVGFMGFGRCDAKLQDAGTHPVLKLQLGE